jgi:peptidoglycan/LPS O-acetylase OafA/YrhL
MSDTRLDQARMRTLFLEILFGIAVAISAILYAAHGPFPWMPHRKWLTLGILTSGIFGVPIWWYRQRCKRPLFWLAFLVLLSAHSISYAIFLSHAKEFPPLWSALSIPLEWVVIFPILANTTQQTNRRRTSG